MVTRVICVLVSSLVLSLAEEQSDKLCEGFSCSNGRCISQKWVCDDENDCGDGTDEESCPYDVCKGFMCTNGDCISDRWVCDHDHDCEDGSDERNCTVGTDGNSDHPVGSSAKVNPRSVASSGSCPDGLVLDPDGVDCADGSTTAEGNANEERTFVMVKPDGVQRGLVGEIIKRLESRGLKLVALKMTWAPEVHIRKHYADLSTRPFFPSLVKYMSSGPVVPMVWEGLNSVKIIRTMLGTTNPADSNPGTIRGDFAVQTGRNVIHGSDSVQSANKEIALWFSDKELVSWTQFSQGCLYEDL